MPLPLALLAALAGAAGVAGIAGVAAAAAGTSSEKEDSDEQSKTIAPDSNSKEDNQAVITKEEKTVGYKVGDTVKLKLEITHLNSRNITARHRGWIWEVTKVSKSGSTEYLDLKPYYEKYDYSTVLRGVEAKYVFAYTPVDSLINNKSNISASANTTNNKRKSNGQYRFTALGLSGSGKTCFMAGMYYKLARGFEGYTLKADDDDDVRLTAMYERMKNASAGQDRFPVGTNQIDDYSFELQYGYETISQFDWIDYDGNALKLKHSGNAKAYQELKDNIASSEILYIFVDGGLFDDEELEDAKTEKDKIEILADIVADSCAAQINHFISEYTKEKQKLPPIAIVVTKYDIVHSVLGKANRAETMEMLQSIIKEAFTPLFPDPNVYRGAGGYTSMVGIIPVSLGSTINENGYTGRLRPINMHLPVYMGIWFMLKKACDFIQSKNLTEKKYTDLLKKQTASMARLADVLEENEVYFCLNGQTGKFSQLAEGYFDALKEKC